MKTGLLEALAAGVTIAVLFALPTCAQLIAGRPR
jgi:hypothetical protein